MHRLILVFLSTESTAGTSLLSMYSTSGLLKESHVDIVSSKETETPSDLVGETSILLETVVAAFLENAVTLLGATTLGVLFVLTWSRAGTLFVLTSSNAKAGVLFAGKFVLRVLAGEPFLALTIFDAQGTYKFEISFVKASKSW